MAINTYQNGSAFPSPVDAQIKGINLREYIATAALQGILARGVVSDVSPQDAAKQAMNFANALLLELFKAQENPA
ncbi:MAG: hypothetical protein ACLQGP_29590 [Isosphaeraceae bacterium]